MKITHFESQKNSMRLRSEAHSSRTLLNGLECILYLVESALRRKDSVIGVVGVTELEYRVSKEFLGLGSARTMVEKEAA